MIVTVEEAKRKWCPFGPTHHHPESGNKEEVDVPKSRSRCIGSACMAWRWSRGHEQRVRQHMDEWPEDNKFTAAAVSGVGYCGLSGEPK